MLKDLYHPLKTLRDFGNSIISECNSLCRSYPFSPLIFDFGLSPKKGHSFCFQFSTQILADDCVTKVPTCLMRDAENVYKEHGVSEKYWKRRSTNGITTWAFSIPLEDLRGDPFEDACAAMMKNL